jgi:hypothetical protein
MMIIIIVGHRRHGFGELGAVVGGLGGIFVFF